jgi:Tol biopolymer transport system component
MGVEMNANLVGQNLGPYRIVDQIGRGGMATVYKAYEPALDRYVAIKVLPQYFAHDPSFSARFDREAKAVARLNHPNILPIYSFGQEGGLSYIAMRYVGEGTLKDRLGPPLDIETALDILRQIGQALDYAHSQGIIHRDVKPSNVLIAAGHTQAPGGGNWVLLADFGLARMVESASQLTKSGVGVGTPAYMSPEQGQGTPVDARSDLYSLGVVLYEMLIGRVPYEAETPMAVVLKHITAPLPMPRSLNPVLPEGAERVILKAMAKNPEDRFQTAQEMVEALERTLEETATLGWLSEEEPEEEPEAEPVPPAETVTPAETLPVEERLVWAPDIEVPPAERLPVEERVVEPPTTEALPVEARPARAPFVKKIPPWAWGAIALFVVLVAVGGVLIATGGWERLVTRDKITLTATSEPISRATSTSRPPTPTPEPAPPARPGRWVAVGPCEGVVPWQICIRDVESGEVVQVTDDLDFREQGVFSWSPDGTQIVFNAGTGPDADGHYDHDIYLINADGSDLVRLTEGEDTDLDPSWSPDYEWIAFHRNCGLWLVHPDGRDAHEVHSGTEEVCVGGTAWSPDGERIAFVDWLTEDNVQGIWVIGRDGSDPHLVYSFERDVEWRQVAWSPDGSQLACWFGSEGWVEGLLFGSEGGEAQPIPENELPGHWLPDHWPQWYGGDGPTGPERWVAVGPCGGMEPWQLCIYDNESGEAIQLTDDLDFGEQGVFAWSPDGGQIVFNAGSGPDADGHYDHDLYVINADGSDLHRITEGETTDLDPSWSPDGEWIAFHRDCGLWLVHPDGSDAHELLEASDDLCVGGTAWSPDGERIVFADWHARDDIHEIWVIGRDASDPHVVYSFEQALEWFITAWSPDGDRLACIYGGEGWTTGFTIGLEGGSEPEQMAEDRLPWHWFPNHRLWEGEWTGSALLPPAGPERWVSIESCADVTPWQLCIYDHESGEVTQLTDDLDFGEPGPAAWSPDGEQIVFNAGSGPNADGHYNHDLYIINADGSDLHRITEGEAADVDPSWSPDGEWIAFHHDCSLRVIHPDGSGAHDLLQGTDELCVGGTTWSPDGGRIAFVDWHARDDVHEIWIVGRDGSDPHVAYSFERALEWFVVAWSPDGDRLACIYGGENWTEGLLFDPDGSNPKQLEEGELPWTWLPSHRLWEGEWAAVEPAPPAGPGRSAYVEACEGVTPWQICIRDEESGEVIQVTDDLDFGEQGVFAWSPDGGQIVFNAGVGPNADGGHDHNLYVINADGSDLRQITEGDVNYLDPSWSPDGEWIASHYGCGLRIIHPDGSGARDLLDVEEGRCVGGTAWSPDGERIAFVDWHIEDDIQEIWVVGRDGSDPHVVHRFEQADIWPVVAWSPDGSQLACIYWREGRPEGFVFDPEGGEPHPIPEEEVPWTWFPNHWPQWSEGDLPSASGSVPQDPWGLIVIPSGDALGIGLVADFSGHMSELGPLYENAVRMAIEDQGHIAGFPVGVVTADGGCGEEMGIGAAQVIIGDPSIAGVVGHACSSSCRAALPIYQEARYVLISPSCTGTDLSTPGYAVFNRVMLRDDQGSDERNREIVTTDPYRDFAARYEERYGQALDGEDLGSSAAYAYDAASILLSAIAKVAVVDSSGALIVGRQSLAEAVRSTPGYPGVTGIIHFDVRGDRLP